MSVEVREDSESIERNYRIEAKRSLASDVKTATKQLELEVKDFLSRYDLNVTVTISGSVEEGDAVLLSARASVGSDAIIDGAVCLCADGLGLQSTRERNAEE